MKRLIVVVPSMRDDLPDWQGLIKRLKEEKDLSGADWCPWPHNSKWFNRISPAELAIRLAAWIHQEWLKSGEYDEVMLVGHSLGGLIVREAYLRAMGLDSPALTYPWAQAVHRIILFSAINRGFNPKSDWTIRPLAWIGRFLPPLRATLGWHVLKGSDFVTNLTIRWIRGFSQIGRPPVVVQIRGANDRVVDRFDSFDMEQFPTAYYIEVPDAVHKDLFRLDTAIDPEGRYKLLRDPFINEAPLRALNITVRGAEKVVFIVHGIRADNRTWAEETEHLIRSQWQSKEVLPIALRYSLVSAAQFAFPPTRKRRLRDFKDAYADALARNPGAEFEFIGHSNGTYLLGESLRCIPGMRFNRVAIVGSVLPEEFDWNMVIDRGQIQRLRSDGSCFDWPVGWLCAALRGLGQKSVGTGGFMGFLNPTDPQIKDEYYWYSGGHSAPLQSENLPALVRFAVLGETVTPSNLGLQLRTEKVAWFAVVSRFLLRYSLILVTALTVIWTMTTIHYGHFADWTIVALLLFIVTVVVLDVI